MTDMRGAAGEMLISRIETLGWCRCQGMLCVAGMGVSATGTSRRLCRTNPATRHRQAHTGAGSARPGGNRNGNDSFQRPHRGCTGRTVGCCNHQ